MRSIEAPVTGSVWKIAVAAGDAVAAADEIVILESMKMEIPVTAEADGVVVRVLVEEGDAVMQGDPLVELEG